MAVFPYPIGSMYGIFTKKTGFEDEFVLTAWVLDAVKTFPGENPDPRDLEGGKCRISRLTVAVRKLGVHFIRFFAV